MTTTMSLQRPLPMDAPRYCTIRAEGTLEPAWSERLGGMGVRASSAHGGPAVELRGRLPDQAALIGVLLSLYNLGLPLISVSCRVAERASGSGQRGRDGVSQETAGVRQGAMAGGRVGAMAR
jgi:hypothetical protein